MWVRVMKSAPAFFNSAADSSLSCRSHHQPSDMKSGSEKPKSLSFAKFRHPDLCPSIRECKTGGEHVFLRQISFLKRMIAPDEPDDRDPNRCVIQ